MNSSILFILFLTLFETSLFSIFYNIILFYSPDDDVINNQFHLSSKLVKKRINKIKEFMVI